MEIPKERKTALRAVFLYSYFFTSLKTSRLRVVLSNFFSSSFRSTFFLFLRVKRTRPEGLFTFIRFTCDIGNTVPEHADSGN